MENDDITHFLLIIILGASFSIEGLHGEDEFIIRPFISQGTLELELKNLDTGARDHLRPNISNVFGVTLGYKAFSLTIGGAAQTQEADPSERGVSEYDDYQIQFHKKRWGLDLIYQNFKGFYHTQYKENQTQYTLVPELKVSKSGVNLFYVFSPEQYSLAAAYSQTERQKQSGFSWIAMATLNQINARGQGPILHQNIRSQFGAYEFFSGFEMLNLGTLFGFGTTLVYEAFYTSFQMLMGPSLQDYKTHGLNRDQFLVAMVQNFRFSLGYNGETYFGGMKYIGDSSITEDSDFFLRPNSNLLEIFVGLRF